MSYDFDLFVIGGGSGGIAAGRRIAGEYGAKVAIAEFDRLGGTCVNRGCIPKKLMMYASRFPDAFLESQGFGWSPTESTFDWGKLKQAVDNELNRLNGVYARMLDKAEMTLYRDYASFVDEHTIQVGDQTVSAEKILIAVGGYPVKPNIPGMEHMLISDELFHLETQPKRVVIIGGGYIGSEFACIFHGLGSDVTQIIRKDKILTGFDEDMRESIQEGMVKHGIQILTSTSPTSIEKVPEGLKLTLKTESG
ncbi:MAG: FAD-dependent oxidoreductase, partial [Cyanobacteria bacterium P01_H01_bin.15]